MKERDERNERDTENDDVKVDRPEAPHAFASCAHLLAVAALDVALLFAAAGIDKQGRTLGPTDGSLLELPMSRKTSCIQPLVQATPEAGE